MNILQDMYLDLSKSVPYLKEIIRNRISTRLEDTPVEVDFLPFDENKLMDASCKDDLNHIKESQRQLDVPLFMDKSDDLITENTRFDYPIFRPAGFTRSSSAILLMHGLNERDWEKYACWAQQLVLLTAKPVILFPIAYHINRAPDTWSNPRQLMSWVKVRNEMYKRPDNLTFANLALSERMTKDPMRFYLSQRETVLNICQLMTKIQKGLHPFLAANCHLDIFAYSIGAMISQILLQSDITPAFKNSKLFMFCGGGTFCQMDGNSRYIMDKTAFDTLTTFYSNKFNASNDSISQAAYSLFNAPFLAKERTEFYSRNQNRIRIITLKKDKVIPSTNVIQAIGEASAVCHKQLDFDLNYSHEVPFPIAKEPNKEVNAMFQTVMKEASLFLS